MSAISLNCKFDAGSKAALDAEMKRLVDELGMEPAAAVRVGTIAALRSLQASTKISPRRRKVIADPRTRAQKNRIEGNRRFVIERFDKRTGQIGRIYILAPDLATAKLSPKAIINKRGLARASWGHAMQRLFGQGGAAPANLAAPSGSLVVSKTSDSYTGFYQAFIENRLNYIAKALSGGRGPAVSTALLRAAGAMKGRTDQRVKQLAQGMSSK